MITLDIIDHALGFIASFLSNIPIIANVLNTFSQLNTELSFISNMQPLIDIFRLARLFLPTGTIVILFSITVIMVAIALLTGLVHFLVHLGNIV